ncbi:hypothetical protein H8E88_10365 [candidate division KSB1 bacterium]|nr:hypothetical protein [candidate division KSB1 bacterium]MBL7093210.1 hypothetical protein [candidate division KSB1 bacterium]
MFNNRIYKIRIVGIAIFLFIFMFLFSDVRAHVKLTYLPNKQLVKNVVLENDHVKYTINIDKGVKLSSAVDKKTNIDYMNGNSDLMFFSQRTPWWLDDVGFQLFTFTDKEDNDKVSVSINQRSSYVENPFNVTQTFTLGNGYELSWNVLSENTATGGRAYREPQTRASNITFPVMQKLKIGETADTHYLLSYGYGAFYLDNINDFIFYFTRDYDPKMPIDIYNIKENRGFYFHIISSTLDFNFKDKDDFKAKVFQVTQKPGEKTEVLKCRISPHQGDWHVAFDTFKKYIRSNFDFKYYKRPVQKKYRQRFISHFTFLYGFDIYDPETNRFRIDEFLDEGELNFGGYDYILLWHDYQRMGIDDRDQFDMYEDLPGGLEGLREMVDKAHARDVQVFIPYKPWDIMKGRKDHFKQEARISKAIGADGVFLDTMDETDKGFREALDAVNPDNVFVSEGRPDLAAAQLVTGSWNQSGNATNKMPNIDLFRFVIPEHNVHNINRGARKRDELIYNALFNGTGFIVWEDIFGEINRYSWNERILISRYNRIIHENRDAYLTDNPIPMVTDFRDDLYVNAFPVSDKCVYPAYQLDRENVNRAADDRLIGPFMEVTHPKDWHFVDVWNHQAIPVKNVNGKSCLVFPEEPTDVMSCIIGMPINLNVELDGNNIHIQTNKPLENVSIQINTVNNLTLMEEEVLKISGDEGDIDVNSLDLKFPYKVLVKLMQGDILKDEVILNLGWKKI